MGTSHPKEGQRDAPKRDQQKTDLDQAYISRLENGTAEGGPAQFLGIARAIGVSIAELYDDQDEAAKRVAD